MAEKILERIDEKLDHVFASSHVEYITAKKRLKGAAAVFSILTNCPNGRKTVAQYRQIIDTFIERYLKEHYQRLIDDVEKINRTPR